MNWSELNVPLENYPFHSPADGYVINVQYLDNDYIVFIKHSNSVQTEFIHLEKLVGPLAHIDGKVSWNKPMRVRVPVKAGEIIALDGGTNCFVDRKRPNAEIFPSTSEIVTVSRPK